MVRQGRETGAVVGFGCNTHLRTNFAHHADGLDDSLRPFSFCHVLPLRFLVRSPLCSSRCREAIRFGLGLRLEPKVAFISIVRNHIEPAFYRAEARLTGRADGFAALSAWLGAELAPAVWGH